MTREAIGIGETEELAKADALNQLGLSSEDGVTFEILKRAEKKKFGIFGGSPAKVKAICEVSDDAIVNGEDLKPQKAVEENTNADAVSEPVSSAHLMPLFSVILQSVLKCCSASSSVGAIKAD